MRHLKHSGLAIRTFYSAPADAGDLDSLDNFDDRTLATLAGQNAGSAKLAKALDDGVDNDNPYRTLPLERWRDR